MSTAFGATKTATVNETPLAYREQGEGDPVVFVHGAMRARTRTSSAESTTRGATPWNIRTPHT
jgi:pimeloyl-ACP methyl ester carboxylesterase